MSLVMRSAPWGLLAAAVLSTVACKGDHTSGPLTPASVRATTPPTFTATVGSVVTPAPAVEVLASNGDPVPGVSVTFTVGAGSGAVQSAIVSTGSYGVATVGQWTLGTTAGQQRLTATVTGLPPVDFAVTVTAGGPTTIVPNANAPFPTSVQVGTAVTPRPSVKVTDAYANVVAGAAVVFSIQSGGGTITDRVATSDASGIATVGSWTVGIRPGTQTLRATLGEPAPNFTLDINANVVAGPPSQMVLAGGADQYARVNTVLPVPPSVQVLDSYSNPVIGGTVTFSPTGVSGSVTGGTATTDGLGVATLGSWTLGATEGVDSLYASASGLPPLPIYARVVPIAQFDIALRFLTPATTTQQAAFHRAVERWRDVVTGDLTDVPVSTPANLCGLGEPALNELIDDVLIYVSLDSIDGPGGILGAAAPCVTRSSNGLPVIGFMHFDTADLAMLEANSRLEAVILHEMGHALGIGTLWTNFNLLSGAGTSDPFFTGASGRQGFHDVGGDAYVGNPVPVENLGGSGTRDHHWRQSVLNTELMTGYTALSAGARSPLSLVTIGSLEDLGYAITPWGYDVFTLGIGLRSGAATPGRELLEAPPPHDPVAIDDNGRIIARTSSAVVASIVRRRIDLVRTAPRQLKLVTQSDRPPHVR